MGLVLGNYEFLKYKSATNEEKIKDIEICTNVSSKTKDVLEENLEKALIICNSVNFTRDIVNSSHEDYYPQIMVDDAIKIAQNNKNIECKIFGEDYLKEKSMNAMLSVGIASPHESKLIHLTYKTKNPIA